MRGRKQRKEVAGGPEDVYTAVTETDAEQRLAESSLKWDAKFPTIAKSLAQQLGPSGSVFRAPPGNSEGDLQDQCN